MKFSFGASQFKMFFFLVIIFFLIPFKYSYGRSQQLDNAKLLFTFQGKGTNLVYDTGILLETYEQMQTVRDQQLILSANSSGAILAIYFSCNGITPDNIKKVKQWMLGDSPRVEESVKAVRLKAENPFTKIDALMKGIIPSIPLNHLDPFIEAALGIDHISQLDQSDCLPKIPFVIAASNYEVLDSYNPNPKQNQLGFKLQGYFEKTFVSDNYSVEWKPQAYRQLSEQIKTQKGKADFERKYPSLKLGDSRYIGKSCTYFASPEMFEELLRVPSEERLCDLRLTATPRDMALAIRASAAEPTYFPSLEDTEPSKLITSYSNNFGDLGNSRKRIYWGGFVMPFVAQDIRRSLPHLKVMGSGYFRFNAEVTELFENLLLVSPAESGMYGDYWADLTINTSKEMSRAVANRDAHIEEDFTRGRSAASECFEKERQNLKRCLPANFLVPKYIHKVRNEGGSDNTPLETKRGVKDLLD